MNDVIAGVLQDAIKAHQGGELDRAERMYNAILNRLPFSEDIAYCLSYLYLQKNYNGLAINLLSGLLQNNPKRADAWCHLGIAFRKENEYDRAKACWERAIKEGGETLPVCNNMSGLYGDRGRPLEALEWIAKSLALEPQNPEANWSKALALLSLKRWDEGWKQYEWRQRLETWDTRKSVIAPAWDGSYVDRLYIHGEQGVGDEVMFASCLPFVKAGHVTLEVHPKVAALMQKSFPDFDVVDSEFPGEYDAKVPIGSLVGRYGFNTNPFLSPDPWRVQFYRDELKKLGPGPHLAIAWSGGTKVTRVEDRSILLRDMKPFLDAYTCVSVQHQNEHDDAIRQQLENDRVEAGLHKINDESTGRDLHEQAALMCAVDAVVTVQQTAVHVAGGCGVKTFAIIGSHPHWRYGIEGDSLPFYSGVRLFRRKPDGDWPEVIARTRDAVDRELSGTKQRAA